MKPTATAALHRDTVTACTVEPVTDYQGLLELEPVWSRLVDEAGADQPFLHHEWVRAWWECFGAGKELRILVVKAGREPVAIAPLMLSKRRLYGSDVRHLEFIWNVYAERFDVLVGARRQEAYRAIWTYLSSQKTRWDVLRLQQVPEGSTTLEEFPRLAAQHGCRVGLWRSGDSPYVPLSGTWERYVKGLPSKHRSNLRNRLKRLGQLGEVSLEIVSSTEHLDHALEDGFRLEAAAWKGQAGTAIRARPEACRFYTRLAQAAARRGSLRLSFLTLDGQRIAFGYYLQYGNKLYLLKPGYDPRFAPYSPSNLLCYLVLRDAFERGIAELDFLAAADPWKLDWTSAVRPHYWLYVFADRLKPRLLHWGKFHLLPRLKQQRTMRMLRDAALNTRRLTRRAMSRWPIALRPVRSGADR